MAVILKSVDYEERFGDVLEISNLNGNLNSINSEENL